MNRSLSIDFLRTFVAIADSGSFSAAAARVGRTVSTVSLQISKLEQQSGQTLFQKVGRRMQPTKAGADLIDHARTILAANDAALAAMSMERLSGTVRFGVLHDTLEMAAARVLADFARMHAAARLSITVDTSRALIDALEAGELDQVIAFAVPSRLPSTLLSVLPMRWIGMQGLTLANRLPVPLVVLDEPCAFRRAALAALDRVRMPYHVVLVSQSLAAVRAAVRVGLGITVRTSHFAASLGDGATVLDGLPPLPQMQLRLYRRTDDITSRTGRALQVLCLERLQERT